jgi:N-acetylmuramoyl-L-alanine amidase
MNSEQPFRGIDRREFFRLGGVGLAGAVLLGTTSSRIQAKTGSSLEAEFESAATEYGVPQELLLAMGYVNTTWEMPPPQANDYVKGDIEGTGTYGIMQLEQNPWRDTLGRASELTGLSEEELRSDRAANIRGGAAVLGDIQGPDKPADLNGWQDAVSEYGGIELYAVEVYETLRNGASATISTGEHVELAPQDVEVPTLLSAQGKADYRRADWRPAFWNHRRKCRNSINFCQKHRGVRDIDLIIIHVAQASYSGTVRTFKRRSGVSAHYVVGTRGQVAQCVRNADVAYHAGWWAYNKRSIGIEHAGFIKGKFSDRQYRGSARLAAYLTKRFNIPVDRQHIIGHNQVPGCPGPGGGVDCHTDPGKHWKWNKYLDLIRHYR